MTDRIIEVTETGAFLRARNGLLVFQPKEGPEFTAPLPDLAALVVAHPAAALTAALIAQLAAAGGALVVCDERRLPAAMLLPLVGHARQAERFARQAEAPRPLRKRLWQAIVRAKLRSQAALLGRLRGADPGLADLIPAVRSGDPDNCEARGARLYWPALFADPTFRREPRGGGLNAWLDYGYAVLRAATARAICAAGLHPAFGLHHHNRYDPFCLADDLMEPFRPLVDEVVALLRSEGVPVELGREVKARLLSPILGRVCLAGHERSVFEALGRLAASLAQVYEGERRDLALPDF